MKQKNPFYQLAYYSGLFLFWIFVIPVTIVKSIWMAIFISWEASNEEEIGK